MTHILLLALVVSACLVRAESSSLSPVASGSPPPLLKKVGRWSRGPVYASAVSGDHVYFGSGGAIRVLKIKRKTSTWQEVASIDASGVLATVALKAMAPLLLIMGRSKRKLLEFPRFSNQVKAVRCAFIQISQVAGRGYCGVAEFTEGCLVSGNNLGIAALDPVE